MKELKLSILFTLNLLLQLLELAFNAVVIFSIPVILIIFGITPTTLITSGILAVLFGTFIVFSLTGFYSFLDLFKQQVKHKLKNDKS
ncbi:hypothetical protein GCQ56_07670 [Marinifilum sp. N1E240]|uniref:hypothetical protein n=1 Tax=Marinifilum sp. N1E240 TaxID=2608082 RepID=UPI00128E2275|nr:hypothetical protein [Marinifilum sp. N1E240]MPQ46891.1 hypothetical protein [Marinifilum sp. N1E240]